MSARPPLAFVSDRAESFIRVWTTLDIEGADEDTPIALDGDDAFVMPVLRMYWPDPLGSVRRV